MFQLTLINKRLEPHSLPVIRWISMPLKDGVAAHDRQGLRRADGKAIVKDCGKGGLMQCLPVLNEVRQVVINIHTIYHPCALSIPDYCGIIAVFMGNREIKFLSRFADSLQCYNPLS